MIKKHLQYGRLIEDKISQHYLDLGYQVLHRNWRTPFGELDLLLKSPDDQYFVAFEIKSLSKNACTSDRVSQRQFKRLQRILQFLISKRPNTYLRFVFVKPDGRIIEINPFS